MLAFIQFQPSKRRFLILNYSLCAAGASIILGIAETAAAKPSSSADQLTIFYDQSRFQTPNDINDPVNTKPDGSNYWLKANFENHGNDTVLLTLTANLKEASGAFIKEVGFNLSNDFNFSGGISVGGKACTQQPGDCQFDEDNVNMANGIKSMDLGISLPTGKNAGRLEGTGEAKFMIKGSGLTADLFNTLSPDGFLSAAKLQGYGIDSNGDGKVDVEGSSTIYNTPGPLPILGVAAAFRTSRRLRRRLTSARPASGRPPAHRPA